MHVSLFRMYKSQEKRYYQREFISGWISCCNVIASVAPQLSQASGVAPECTIPQISHVQTRRRKGTWVANVVNASLIAVYISFEASLVIILCAVMYNLQ